MSGLVEAIRRLGTEIPDEHKAEFNMQVLYRNLVRVRVVCWALLLALIPYGIADYFTLTGMGTPESARMALGLTCIRGVIVLFTIYYLVRIGLPAGPEDLRPRHKAADIVLVLVYMVYMGFTLGFMYSFRTELSVYLLFILVASAFFTWTTTQSCLLLGAAFVSLAISLPLFGAHWASYQYGLITLGVMTGISFVLAQVTRRNRIEDFLKSKTIERQNRELVRERAEAESARKVAVKASQAKSDFLAAMSHEIRTPMNAVIGMTEVTLETDLHVDQRRYLETVHDSAKQLMAIINDILDFSKIEAGKLSVEHVDFNLRAMLESVVRSFRPMADARMLDLGLEVEGELPQVCKGDPLRLRQVLMNLLSNAIKFTERGSVTLSVWPGLLSADGTLNVRFSVIDTGIGVPEEKRGVIFERFSQADSSITRMHGGTGLGLAISRRLAELMEGSLSYEPGFDGGSVFTLVVPLEPSSLQEEREAVREWPEGRSLHILVADDSSVNSQVVQTQLQMLGHTSEAVASGAEALEMLNSREFSLVLMDVEMPGMDGMAATRLIRQGGPNRDWPDAVRDIPVFTLTAHAVEEVRVEAREAGMTKYLTKPIRMKDLEQALCGIDSPEGAAPAFCLLDQLFDPRTAMEFLGLEQEAYVTALRVARKELGATLAGLETASEAENVTEIGQRVHTFKGAAHIMGSVSAVDAAVQVEEAIRQQRDELVLRETGKLLEILRSLETKVDLWLDMGGKSF